jgi:hypothetical protein
LRRQRLCGEKASRSFCIHVPDHDLNISLQTELLEVQVLALIREIKLIQENIYKYGLCLKYRYYMAKIIAIVRALIVGEASIQHFDTTKGTSHN